MTRRINMRKWTLSFRSWRDEIKRSASKEVQIRELFETTSLRRFRMIPIGVGTEGREVSEADKAFSQKLPDYVIWNVESGRLVALCDMVSTTYSWDASKFFPLSLWKRNIIHTNHFIPTALIYELEGENAKFHERLWWWLGVNVPGKILYDLATNHWDTKVEQDIVATPLNIWTRGLGSLIKKLLDVPDAKPKENKQLRLRRVKL